MNPTRRAFALEPLDTLLFRDGRPFDQSDEGLTETRSLFPPFPSVLAGALRAELARVMGWDGKSDWCDELQRRLGNGPLDAGELQVGPPVILRAFPNANAPVTNFGYDPLYSCPAALRGRFNDERILVECGAIRPCDAPEGIATDLGLQDNQAFSIIDANDPDAFEPLQDWLVTRNGLRAFLEGAVPTNSELVKLSDLVPRQNRVGLQRNYQTHGAETGMLYAASYVRPLQNRVSPGPGKIAIGVSVSLPEDCTATIPCGSILPLGSMGRAAAYENLDERIDLDPPSINAEETITERGYCRYCLVLLSPALRQENQSRNGGLRLPDGHELVSAVIPKPIAFSGWDASAKGPADMRRHLAPGTTWYLRFKGHPRGLQDHFDMLTANGINKHGASVGFGAVAIGTWRYSGEESK